MSHIRANTVQVDKIFRASCQLPGCSWAGSEWETYQDANTERQAHLALHREAAPEPSAAFSDAMFARRLSQVRRAAGITQQELADRMTAATGHKMYRSAIAKTENGYRSVPVGEAVQFAKCLDVPFTMLMTEATL